MPFRLLRILTTAAACVLWTLCGVVMPLLLLVGGSAAWTTSGILVIAGCIAAATLASRVVFDFGEGAHRLTIALDTTFVLLAALLLDPPQAAIVAVLGGVYALRHASALRMAATLLNASAAAALASAAVRLTTGDVPTPALVLPAALVAALVYNVVSLAGSLLASEAAAAGGAMRLLRTTPVLALLLLEVGLPVAALSMAAPHLHRPTLALAIAAGFCGVIWLVLRTLHRQQRDQHHNEYLRDTVSRYMPQHVAEHLIDRRESRELGGTQHEITVLFCDIRGFTSWAEQSQPDDVITELNRLLTDLAQAILDTDGTLDKFTGDGLMAFWGAPDQQPDHAVRAMRSVPRMLMRVREFNMEREARGETPLEVGIGIHSGLAMVGNVGHRQRLNYTAVGDTVNLAARLEQSTKQFNCPLLVSESTFIALPTTVQRQLVRLDSISVKGRRDRVRLYTLLYLARFRNDMTPRRTA